MLRIAQVEGRWSQVTVIPADAARSNTGSRSRFAGRDQRGDSAAEIKPFLQDVVAQDVRAWPLV
jgi:hypothetical protein